MSSGKIEKIGTVSAQSVLKHTKKNWDYWIAALDRVGAKGFTHQELVKILKTKFKVKPWWAQEVARGYQIHLGKRVIHQTLKGTYTTTATKSVNGSAKKVFDFMLSDAGQEIWLKPMATIEIEKGSQFECTGGIFGEIRTLGKSPKLYKLRMAWNDENWEKKSTLQLWVIPKPNSTCMIAFSHDDLPTFSAKAEMHERWRLAVNHLASLDDVNPKLKPVIRPKTSRPSRKKL